MILYIYSHCMHNSQKISPITALCQITESCLSYAICLSSWKYQYCKRTYMEIALSPRKCPVWAGVDILFICDAIFHNPHANASVRTTLPPTTGNADCRDKSISKSVRDFSDCDICTPLHEQKGTEIVPQQSGFFSVQYLNHSNLRP